MKKKLAALLMTFAMAASLVSTGVFAGEERLNFVNVNSTRLSDPNNTESVMQLGEGTLTWDPATFTMTLDNITVVGDGWNTSGAIEIVFEEAQQDNQVTLVLKGENSITSTSTAIYCRNGDLTIRAEEGASLTVDSVYNSIHGNYLNSIWVENGSLTIEDGSYDMKAGYPVINATDGIAIGGASLTAHSEVDYPVYSKSGGIVLNNATVNITSNYEDAVGLYAGSESEGIVITNSTVDVNTKSTSLLSKGDVSIADSTVNIVSGANPINAKKNVAVTGQKTNLTTSGANPIAADGTIQIDGAAVSATATNGTAISGTAGVAIQNGAQVNAGTTAKMSAIYSEQGNIEVKGETTSVTASSTQDSAIFTRNGNIILESGTVNVTAAKGFSPIVARTSGTANDPASVPAAQEKIQIGEGLTLNGAKVAATNWKTADGEGGYYSDVMLVPADVELDENGLLPEGYSPTLSEVTVNEYVAPTPKPTAEPWTPNPTPTPTPVPAPTATPKPAATARPKPTATPAPTEAPAEATPTPEPAEPTPTPAPTEAPAEPAGTDAEGGLPVLPIAIGGIALVLLILVLVLRKLLGKKDEDERGY